MVKIYEIYLKCFSDMYHYYEMPFSFEEVDRLLKEGKAVEATMGGLILGRSHDEGGIYFLVKRDGRYVLEGEVEGYEYILNLGATWFYEKSTHIFHQHEKHTTPVFDIYEPAPHIVTIDARHPDGAKYILFETGGFSIMNRYSTKGYLETLDRMNKAVTFKRVGEKAAKTKINSRERIDIYFGNHYEGHFPASEKK
jgi:hypothetical protein